MDHEDEFDPDYNYESDSENYEWEDQYHNTHRIKDLKTAHLRAIVRGAREWQ